MKELAVCVLQAQAGSENAFGRLYTEFFSSVIGWLIKKGVPASDLEDLCQNIFIQAKRKLKQLKNPLGFPYWLKLISQRMAINHHHSSVRKRKHHLNGNEVGNCKHAIVGLINEERKKSLFYSIARLKDDDQKAIEAFYFEGLTYLQMSERFSVPVGTIKRRLHVARNRLRTRLELIGFIH